MLVITELRGNLARVIHDSHHSDLNEPRRIVSFARRRSSRRARTPRRLAWLRRIVRFSPETNFHRFTRFLPSLDDLQHGFANILLLHDSSDCRYVPKYGSRTADIENNNEQRSRPRVEIKNVYSTFKLFPTAKDNDASYKREKNVR